MAKRTHRCGQLQSGDVGQSVVLMGWVRRHRDHGRVVFLDLWDRDGLVQIVADPTISEGAYEIAQSLRDQYVVAVQGAVRERPAGAENLALATGA
ncbi:MAG: OB-fold nucleic acid binding domain-containing protein, partial [Anaerolineae bacterium]|nr:OB-fold nucleic acid binding domain-containing protein [Anaerolineae bacterium]